MSTKRGFVERAAIIVGIGFCILAALSAVGILHLTPAFITAGSCFGFASAAFLIAGSIKRKE